MTTLLKHPLVISGISLGKQVDIPEVLKKEKWVETGINIEDGFSPLYIIPKEKKEQIKKLKDALKKADILYLSN